MKKICAVLSTLIVLLSCGCGAEEEPASKTLVYDTNKYLTYKRMLLLASNSYEWDSSRFQNTGEGTWLYETENMSLEITEEENCVEYEIFLDNSVLVRVSRDFVDNPTGVVMYYTDINNDKSPDVILIGEPPRGTLTGPYWTYAYDIKNKTEINLFDESGELTELQKQQLDKLLTKDFYEVFGNRDDISFEGGHPYIDSFGNIYYEIAVMTKITTNTGEALLHLSFDAETDTFQVMELQYMPRYIE